MKDIFHPTDTGKIHAYKINERQDAYKNIMANSAARWSRLILIYTVCKRYLSSYLQAHKNHFSYNVYSVLSFQKHGYVVMVFGPLSKNTVLYCVGLK